MCKSIIFLQRLKQFFGPSWIMAKCLFLVFMGLLASAVALASMAFVVGKFNVNRETADVLTLLAPIMGWMLALVLVTYAIRFNGFREKVLNLLDRISKIGIVEFGNFTEKDQENLSEMISAAVIDAMKRVQAVGKAEESTAQPLTGNDSPDGDAPPRKTEMEKTLDRQARFMNWEAVALQRHREKYGGVQLDCRGNGRILWKRFDGVIRRNEEIIALEVKAVRESFSPRMSLTSAIRAWASVKDSFMEIEHKNLLLEVLFCADESFQNVEDLSNMIRRCIVCQPNIRVYLYQFNSNDTISKVEEIA